MDKDRNHIPDPNLKENKGQRSLESVVGNSLFTGTEEMKEGIKKVMDFSETYKGEDKQS